MTEQQSPNNIYALFWLFRSGPQWRQLSEKERAARRDDFASTMEQYTGDLLILRGAYSLTGLRHDADLLLWLHGPDLEVAQDLAVALRRGTMGPYLETPYTYTGVVTPSRYAPNHRAAFIQGIAPCKYVSMYPFTKTNEWYLLPFEQRRDMMIAHGRLGQPHSAVPETLHAVESARSSVAVAERAAPPQGRVLTNTVHSFGLGDQEFVVAFESDDPAALSRMVEDLRVAEVRRYTALDVPVFLGRRGELRAVLQDLG